LVNGSVSCIKLSRQIVETRVASGLPDFLFLRGSHVVILTGAKNLGSQETIKDVSLRST
jgi:predicted type IV restriction endonuclease